MKWKQPNPGFELNSISYDDYHSAKCVNSLRKVWMMKIWRNLNWKWIKHMAQVKIQIENLSMVYYYNLIGKNLCNLKKKKKNIEKFHFKAYPKYQCENK